MGISMVAIIPVPARSSQVRPNRGKCRVLDMPGISCAALATAGALAAFSSRVNLKIFIAG